MDNKSLCSGDVIKAREIIESDRPNYSDAKSLLNKALKLATSYKGTEDKAYILHELGYVSYKTDAYNEAISYYDRSIKEKKKYSADKSIEITQTIIAKGLAFIKMGLYKQALPLFENALISAPHTENDSTYKADALINIAIINREMGVYDKAKEAAEDAERIASSYLGSESKKTAYIINCVGSVYAKIGMEKDAKDKFESALRIFRLNSPSENSLDIVYTYLKLASLYELNKNCDGLKKVPNCLKKAFERLERMPEDSMAVKRSLSHAHAIRAKYLYLSGDYDKAIEYCEKAAELSRDFGVNHPKTIETDIVYGDALFAKKKTDAAKDHYQKAYKVLRSINPNHPDIVDCIDKISACK